MEGITTFALIIVVIFGILQIILFFKLWKMTNDIHKMKEKSLGGSLSNDAKVLFLKGKKEDAYDRLLDAFLQDVVNASNSTWTSNPENDYKVDYRNLLERYRPIFDRIGLGHPDYTLYDELNKVKI